MKRIATTVAAALISAAFSSAALAQQDKPTAPADSPNAGKRIQSPDKSNVQRQNPSSENMDSNVQRQHSRSTPSASGQSSTQRGQQVQAGDVRDWNAIDKDKDHLISPDEMEAYLAQGRKQ